MRWSSFWRWCFPRSRAHLDVLMYTRAGCHLCDDVWTFLEAEQRRYGFRLTSVDVDSVPELAARHGTDVPVVLVAGKVRFRGKINRALWERLLPAEVRQARLGPNSPGAAAP